MRYNNNKSIKVRYVASMRQQFQNTGTSASTMEVHTSDDPVLHLANYAMRVAK